MPKQIKNILIIIIALFASSNVYALTDESQVSLRELAMLASLAYEPAPDTELYKDAIGGNYCIYDDNDIMVDSLLNEQHCRYTFSDNDKVTWNYKINNKEYKVDRYIEGMSQRRLNMVTDVLSQTEEAGVKYHFYNYVNYDEFDDWSVSNVSKRVSASDLQTFTGFYGITFKKGHNYVIAFRGTDLPDAFEWYDDLFIYGKWSKSTENDSAYRYAQFEYNRIVSKDPDAKIYVTGHSLGAYLAEIGGAAIADLGKEGANYTNKAVIGTAKTYKTMQIADEMINPDTGTTITSYSDYDNIYCNPDAPQNKNGCYSSHLVQVAYFNGMGVSAMNLGTNVDLSTNYVKSISQALVYLSTHLQDGTLVDQSNVNQKYSLLSNNTAISTVNYSDSVYSSGRLVLYSMKADIVTGMGVHFGEIVRLQPGLDSINYHKGLNTTVEESEESAENTIELYNNLKSLTEKLKAIKAKYNSGDSKDYTESISKILSMFITNNTIFSEGVSSDLIPDAVLNVVNREANTQSVVNFWRALYLAADEYAAGGLSTAMNLGHETDSFFCAIDSEYGIPEINLTASSSVMKNGQVYSYNKANVTLVADVTKGCANSYTWYKVVPGGQAEEVTEGKNLNYLVVDGSTLVSGTKYYVTIEYGTYYGTMSVDSANDDYDYQEKELEGVSEYNKYMKSSNTLTVNAMVDKTSPTCTVPSQITAEKVCTTKKILGIFKRTTCTGLDTILNVTCTDKESGVGKTTADYKVTNNGFLFWKNIETSLVGTSISIKPLRKTSDTYINLNYKVCDNANNCTTVKNRVKFIYN